MSSEKQPEAAPDPVPVLVDYKRLNPVCARCPAPATFLRIVVFSNGGIGCATLCERCQTEESGELSACGFSPADMPQTPGIRATGGRSHN